MALPPMRAIYSSHVDSADIPDAETKTLYVKWDSGKVSAYPASRQLADEIQNSWSVGKALTTQIKSAFPHRYV